MEKIPYGRQSISDEDVEAVCSVLKSDFLTQGPKVEEFEQKFASLTGAKYAVAVANGTAALHISAMALGVVEGTRVITAPITFVASANCIKYCGGTVDFVDVDPESIILDIEQLRLKLQSAPWGTYDGIVVIDFAGCAANFPELHKLAKEYGLWILEDACHAPGGYFKDSNGDKHYCGSGAHADLSCFSFHPVKHIACGEGGMITTNDEGLYRKLRDLRSHGITKDAASLQENHGAWYYEMQSLGFNYRLSDIHAALGVSQLEKLDTNLNRRREIAEKYDNAFEGTQIRPIQTAQREGHAFHLYVVRVNERKKLYEFLKEHGILCQIHYIPVHMQPYYRELQDEPVTLEHAEDYYSQCLSLPIYPTLSEAEQNFVIEKCLAYFSHE